ncbi:MAG: hypothetical protein NTV40_01675 [Solirubrobacterales bacterium]|nr:hypothetical protein [Solirubrobacterales bacterium]
MSPVCGFGILGTRERAELLGATVIFESTYGVGTTVEASLPL